MRLLFAAAVVLGLAAPALALPASTGEYDAGHRVCRFQDARVGESSGVASASYSDRFLWTHNDSGDTGRFFLVDTAGCETVASYSISVPPSVQEPNTGESLNNSDIEDMARGKTADGRPMLLLADIGDNQQARDAHVVYEMAEPDGHVTDPQTEQPQMPLAIHTFAYPSQPWDAEAVAVTPDRRLVIVTKPRSEPDLAYTGKSEIYESATAMASSGVDALVMQKVANVDLTALVGELAGNPVAVTSADMTQDGRRFAIRTYTTAFEWPVGPDGDLATAVAHAPAVLELLPSAQGEGIAYSRDGHSLWTSSEGSGTNIDPISGVVDRYDAASPAPVLAESQRPALVLGGAVVAAALLLLALTGRRRSVM
jgi:hypothetical protein